ncbi:MAG: hypothetical protein R3D33_12975 [Hyphomicrobiaceae bacterium]
MDSETIRSLVRDVLSEEIARFREARGLGAGRSPSPQVCEEIVSIRSDEELSGFVARLCEILKDGRSREEIESGRWVFRLGTGSGGASAAAGSRYMPGGAPVSPAAKVDQVARIERGMVSERQIEALPDGTTRLVIGKAVRFTPLARDRLRLRGIAIERSAT